jgi:hypothetical protein
MSECTAILMPVRDRQATVSVCLPAWAREKEDMDLWVFDDNSRDFDEHWLLSLGADHVVRHEVFSKPCDWSITLNIISGLQRLISEGYSWIYVADSDTYPTRGFRELMKRASGAARLHSIVSFFNSSHQNQWYPTLRTWCDGVSMLERERCPGCSMLLDVRELGSTPYGITRRLHDECGAWDHVLAARLGPVAITETSLVEHLGAGGLHNPGSWEIDRAVNPTEYLREQRPLLIKQIEERS